MNDRYSSPVAYTGARLIARMMDAPGETKKSLLIVSKSVDLAFAQFVRSLAAWLLGTFPNLKLTLDARLKGVFGGLETGVGPSRVSYWDPGFCAACYGSIDLIVTLGGDGTVLYTSWLFQKCTVCCLIAIDCHRILILGCGLGPTGAAVLPWLSGIPNRL